MPKTAADLRFADIHSGDTFQFEVDLTEEMVDRFAALSGDQNPLHMDDSYAALTPFKGRIAHGLLGASFFSRLIGMHLPGKNALYLSQKLSFRAPMRIGIRLLVSGVVSNLSQSTRVITVETSVTDAATKQLLIGGEAVVRLLL